MGRGEENAAVDDTENVRRICVSNFSRPDGFSGEGSEIIPGVLTTAVRLAKLQTKQGVERLMGL
jgi:hypothetical protein